MDVVMLDGYLAGVIVQPELISPERWLPGALGVDALPDGLDERWLARVRALAERRFEALALALEEDGVFDPVIYVDGPDDPVRRDAARELPAHSAPLMEWVAGFDAAARRFPALAARADAAPLLARLARHLPAGDDAARALVARLDRELPLRTLDDAIDDLALAVAELWELTADDRLRVATVRRDAPKVGRNEPCPCGSGRKYKHCHGSA
jgi:uncharacterized protein